MTPQKPLKKALKIIEKLNPFCEKIDVVGSLRTRAEFRNKIEIVCIPKKEIILYKTKHTNIEFNQEIISLEFIKAITKTGNILKGKPNDVQLEIELCDGIILVVYLTKKEDYFRQIAIHSGSEYYIRKNIISKYRKMGWCDTGFGLRKLIDCDEFRNKDLICFYVCEKINAELPPIWKDENKFFQWLKLKYVEPKHRNI